MNRTTFPAFLLVASLLGGCYASNGERDASPADDAGAPRPGFDAGPPVRARDAGPAPDAGVVTGPEVCLRVLTAICQRDVAVGRLPMDDLDACVAERTSGCPDAQLSCAPPHRARLDACVAELLDEGNLALPADVILDRPACRLCD